MKHGVMHIEDVVRGLKKRDREMHSTSLSHSIDIFLFFFFFLPSLRSNDRDRLYTHACAIVSRIKKIENR